MIRRRWWLIVAVVAVLLTTTPSVSSSQYRYQLLDWGWKEPNTLTACFYQGGQYTHRDRTGNTFTVKPLPPRYQSVVRAAANIWSDTPGIPVTITVVDACNSASDIKVAATSADEPFVAFAGCTAHRAEESDGLATDNVCAARSGLLVYSDYLNPEEHAKFYTYVTVHELGHVLGLGHPAAAPCENECYGPVMSFGSCPRKDNKIDPNRCLVTPNKDDQAGIRWIHYGNEDGETGGGGCSVAIGFGDVDPSKSVGRLPRPDDVASASVNLPLDGEPVMGQSMVGWPKSPIAGALDPLRDPVDYGLTISMDLLAILAQPEVDAYSTLVATAGKGWESSAVVMDEVGMQDPVEQCLYS